MSVVRGENYCWDWTAVDGASWELTAASPGFLQWAWDLASPSDAGIASPETPLGEPDGA